jgi:hypothetical protein
VASAAAAWCPSAVRDRVPAAARAAVATAATGVAQHQLGKSARRRQENLPVVGWLPVRPRQRPAEGHRCCTRVARTPNPVNLGVAASARAGSASRSGVREHESASALTVVCHCLTLPAAELCGVKHGCVATLEDAGRRAGHWFVCLTTARSCLLTTGRSPLVGHELGTRGVRACR